MNATFDWYVNADKPLRASSNLSRILRLNPFILTQNKKTSPSSGVIFLFSYMQHRKQLIDHRRGLLAQFALFYHKSEKDNAIVLQHIRRLFTSLIISDHRAFARPDEIAIVFDNSQ